MGVIDEVKPSDSDKDKSSLPVNPSISTSKNGSGEAPVPQMLITSAEEVNKEIELSIQEQNVVEEKPALTTITEENEEEKEIKEKRDGGLSAQQRPLVISAVSEVSHGAGDESLHDHEKEQPRTESPPLSAIQRPLMLEQVPPQSVTSGVQETQPESAHDHALSTVQRPLVFDSSSVPYDSTERITPSLPEPENINIREQNIAQGFNEPSTCPVLSARTIDEGSDEIPRESQPEEISSSPVEKFKGFFTKADGTSIFSLPKIHASSSKEHTETSKEEKDALQIQVTPDETHITPETVHTPDKNIEDQHKEDSKTSFSLPKFSFPSFKESKSKDHSHGPSPDVHLESTAAVVSDADGKEHSKDGSKVTFSLPKFSFSSSKESKEASKKQVDSPLDQTVESHPVSAEAAGPESHSAEVAKEDSKHGFHLPKFSFGSSKESKEIQKGHHDSTGSQNVEIPPGTSEAVNVENYSAETVKEESKHGFHLPKFSFGSSKGSKEMPKEQHDATLNQDVGSPPTSAEVADRGSHSVETAKEGSKHGFHLPKFGFGSSKETKEISKEQHDASLSQATSAEKSPSAEVKEESTHGFSLPKFSFGTSKESKDISKQSKDGSMSHSIAVEKPPSPVEVIDSETVVRGVKEDSKHTFQFPKFSFGSSKEPKPSSQEASTSPVPAPESPADSSKVVSSDSSSQQCPPESGKSVFSLPKLSFGISKDHKEDSKESKSVSSVKRPVSIEVSGVDANAKGVVKEDSKHSFSFPKFGLGSPKSPTKEPKGASDTAEIPAVVVEDRSSVRETKADAEVDHTTKESIKRSFSFPKFGLGSPKSPTKEPKGASDTAEIPAVVVEDRSSVRETKVDAEVDKTTKASIKRSFSFPKFSFGSSKEDEAFKESKDSSKVAKSDVEGMPVTEDSKHTFSFPKFSLSSSKDSKEVSKHPKDGAQLEAGSAENYQASAVHADVPAESKPFSFPKIRFGSFREHKETAKEKKDIESSPVAHESQPGITEVERINSSAGVEIQKLQSKEAVKKGAPLASEERDPFNKPKKSKEAPERTSSFKTSKKEESKEPQNGETPSSLYETCCMRLAGMICNKAIEIVSEHTTKRGPPKKPPKPTAEAIAKARAAIVAKRVQEYERRRNFGDDIPLGYNGIRFVDDDTESSTDYKDVDNTAYIIDSDCSIIVRRMKSENILESFSCPSLSSYHTADEMTLKDGNFSDNTLESVSLGSEDSLAYKLALSSLSEEIKPELTKDQIDSQKTVSFKKPVEKQKSSPASFSFFGWSKSTTPKKEISAPVVQKRVPPPIPPKPVNWPRSESQVKIEVPSPAPEVKKCVDTLSLSPRPVTRNLPATGGIKSRPLTIAGIKETEFPMYMRNIRTEETQKKPILTTLVKNQALEKVPVISASTSALDKPLSPPSKPSDIQATSVSSLTTKTVPQRPPPPVKYVKSSSAVHIPASEGALSDARRKPKPVSSVVLAPKPAYKPRPHISPPRPPPPQIKATVSRPPRPPPPSTVITGKISQGVVSADAMQLEEKPLEEPGKEVSDDVTKTDGREVICDKSEISDVSKSISPPDETPSEPVSVQVDPGQSADAQLFGLDDKLESSKKTDAVSTTEYVPSSVQNADTDKTLNELTSQTDLDTSDIKSAVTSVDTTSEKQVEDDKNHTDDQIAVDKLPKTADNLNENIAISKMQVGDVAPVPSPRASKKPRPPPRVRRIRSRTVEIVSVVWKPEERKRRSQSLSEMDVRKRVDTEDALKVDEKPELKALYTPVHKDPTKSKSEQLNVDIEKGRKSPSPEKISSRPLPPPPPPPRAKHYSESRKQKLDTTEPVSQETPGKSTEHLQNTEAELPIKPPVRKKKEEKLRSQSLEDKDKGAKDSPSQSGKKPTVSIDRANSFTSGVPKKPRRKPKISSHEFHFDENANIAETIIESPVLPKRHTVSHPDLTTSSGSKTHTKEHRSSSEKQVKRRSPALDTSSKKSHSSWYDESDVSGDLGDVDTLPGSLKASTEKLSCELKNSDTESSNPNKNKLLREKQDSVKKPRETSKFYVDIDANVFEETTISPKAAEDAEPHITHVTVDKETSPLPLECSEKSVQTSLETLSQGMVSRSEQSDDTDELLDLAQTLQDELKTILSRHKQKGPEGESDDTSGSQNQLDAPGSSFEKAGPSVKRRERKPHTTRAAASSDLWQVSSSDESDESTEDQTKAPPETLMERKKKRVFYIAQEIMTSEEAFVDALKLLNIDFRNVIDEANKQKGSPVVPSDVVNQVLNHLPQLQHLNENLLMELKERIEHWDDEGKIADVIVKMGPFLKLYSWYIQEFESMVSLLDDAKKKYPAFAQVVKEFENTPRCNRLALNHYLLKPVQRIPQYRLLLQEYLHHLPKESPDYNDTLTALQIVSEVANHANESMKQGDNFQKLISIQNSIFGHKEIIKPGRIFVKEGELMKLSRKGMQPRWFVLLSDVLLYLTPVQQGLFRVNHELTLTGMKVAIPIQQDYQNEFSIISVTRSFTLAAKSPEERQEWIIALTKAIEENASKRSTFTNVRLQQKVVCSVCSSNRAALHYLGNRNARVCDECYHKLEQGSGGGYTESGETDSDNQQIAVKAHLRTDSRHGRKLKRQLPSVLKEVCANDQGSSISGYLMKKSGKSWKRDWFVVKDKVLYEYKASEDVAALRSLPLLGYQIETFSEPFEGIDSSVLFQLTHPGQPPVVLHADNTVAAERWISALKEATVLE